MPVPRGNLGVVRRIGNSGDHWGRSPRSDEETIGAGPSGETRIAQLSLIQFRDLTRPALDPISDARGRPPLLLAGG